MFEFQMDIKDSESANPQKVAELGMVQVDDARYYNPKYRVEGFTPKNINEALEYVNQAFFFIPLYVWVDGKKLDPLKEPNKFVEVVRTSRK